MISESSYTGLPNLARSTFRIRRCPSRWLVVAGARQDVRLLPGDIVDRFAAMSAGFARWTALRKRYRRIAAFRRARRAMHSPVRYPGRTVCRLSAPSAARPSRSFRNRTARPRCAGCRAGARRASPRTATAASPRTAEHTDWHRDGSRCNGPGAASANWDAAAAARAEIARAEARTERPAPAAQARGARRWAALRHPRNPYRARGDREQQQRDERQQVARYRHREVAPHRAGRHDEREREDDPQRARPRHRHCAPHDGCAADGQRQARDDDRGRRRAEPGVPDAGQRLRVGDIEAALGGERHRVREQRRQHARTPIECAGRGGEGEPAHDGSAAVGARRVPQRGQAPQQRRDDKRPDHRMQPRRQRGRHGIGRCRRRRGRARHRDSADTHHARSIPATA